jgi:hypothetical protein
VGIRDHPLLSLSHDPIKPLPNGITTEIITHIDGAAHMCGKPRVCTLTVSSLGEATNHHLGRGVLRQMTQRCDDNMTRNMFTEGDTQGGPPHAAKHAEQATTRTRRPRGRRRTRRTRRRRRTRSRWPRRPRRRWQTRWFPSSDTTARAMTPTASASRCLQHTSRQDIVNSSCVQPRRQRLTTACAQRHRSSRRPSKRARCQHLPQ